MSKKKGYLLYGIDEKNCKLDYICKIDCISIDSYYNYISRTLCQSAINIEIRKSRYDYISSSVSLFGYSDYLLVEYVDSRIITEHIQIENVDSSDFYVIKLDAKVVQYTSTNLCKIMDKNINKIRKDVNKMLYGTDCVYSDHTYTNDYYMAPSIKEVIYHQPATIVKFNDGTSICVKCSEDDEFDEHIGLAMALSKKYLEIATYNHPRAAFKHLKENAKRIPKKNDR